MSEKASVNEGGGVLFFKSVPEPVKNLWKAFCARRGITMTQRIIELMRDDIQKDADLGNDLKRSESAKRSK